MKIILIKDYENLGKKGNIIEVKDGFARNFLIPQKIAVIANQHNLKVFQHQQELLEKNKEKERKNLKELAEKLSQHSFNIQVKTGTSGKLFGNVTKDDIYKAIVNEFKIKIDKHNILLKEDIKEIGIYTVDLKLESSKYPEISETAKIKIWVISENG